MITADNAQHLTAMNYKTEIDRLRDSFTSAVKTVAEFGESKAYFNSTAKYETKLQLLSDIRALGYKTDGWFPGVSHNFHDITVYWGE
jgi:hypothetical protein